MSTADIIYEKSKSFPEPVAKEALEFIKYLEYRYQVVIQKNKPKKIINKLAKLKPHNIIIGDSEDLVSLKLDEWNGMENL